MTAASSAQLTLWTTNTSLHVAMLAERIADRAARYEADLRVPDETIEEFRETGLHKTLLPAAYGVATPGVGAISFATTIVKSRSAITPPSSLQIRSFTCRSVCAVGTQAASSITSANVVSPELRVRTDTRFSKPMTRAAVCLIEAATASSAGASRSDGKPFLIMPAPIYKHDQNDQRRATGIERERNRLILRQGGNRQCHLQN